ncbi:g4050 [Coccomyxa elongata]
MHKLYAESYTAVEASWCLNIRKTQYSLDRIREEDVDLFKQYERLVHGMTQILPITEDIKHVLQLYNGFSTSKVRDLFRHTGVQLDRTERLANALGHLAGVLQELSALEGSHVKMALFAGRRSSDRLYLLLQNLLCARHLPHYMGTSSVFAVTLIDRALRDLGITDAQQRVPYTGRLVGTHAHELVMITAKLLARYDDAAGSAEAPIPIAALLAHLLYLRANGGLDSAIALADTFGTAAFVEAALVSEVPAEFLEDMADTYPQESQPQPGCMVFDLFTTWRLDSGSYEEIAEVVVSAWERRCAAVPQGMRPPQRPALMHSNLRSAEEVLQVCSLPERIRPAFCAFGGVTDGFLPFELPSGESFEVGLASVVMKAVQAHVPGAAAADESAMPSAGKLGDDANLVKAQVDPRLPEADQEKVKARMEAMFHCRKVDSLRASRALAAAYHDVTREHCLCQAPDPLVNTA